MCVPLPHTVRPTFQHYTLQQLAIVYRIFAEPVFGEGWNAFGLSKTSLLNHAVACLTCLMTQTFLFFWLYRIIDVIVGVQGGAVFWLGCYPEHSAPLLPHPPELLSALGVWH